MRIGKLFQPRAPEPASEAGLTVQFHFGQERRKDGSPVFNTPTPPALAAAVERVKAEIAELRSQVATGESARSERQLRSLVEQYRTALHDANKKLERIQRQVLGGTAEIADADGAMAVRNTAYARLNACNAELVARLKTDEASEKLRSLLAELA